MHNKDEPIRHKLERIHHCISARMPLFDREHQSALRLFNGFTEGIPGLEIELFGRTAVILNKRKDYATLEGLARQLASELTGWLPWIEGVLYKARHNAASARGVLLYGERLNTHIVEAGVTYAIDLQMQQDNGFYLDTRNLRQILRTRVKGQTLLNTFAYTGSLGVAALAGGARKVVQTDRNRAYLDFADKSAEMSGLDKMLQTCIAGDFFRVVAALKRECRLFDWVIVDPPFFSASDSGRVDLEQNQIALINKVRPLVAHIGTLVVVNNGLYVSGEDFLNEIRSLTKDGYLSVEEMMPIPLDCTGYPETINNPAYPADYTPFNSPTKIILLRVTRKDKAEATG